MHLAIKKADPVIAQAPAGVKAFRTIFEKRGMRGNGPIDEKMDGALTANDIIWPRLSSAMLSFRERGHFFYLKSR